MSRQLIFMEDLSFIDALEYGTYTDIYFSSEQDKNKEIVATLKHQQKTINIIESPESIDPRANICVIITRQESIHVSRELMKYLSFKNCTIIAPKTDRYYKNNPLFLISIPKAGTHLLYRLAEAFGYTPEVELINVEQPGSWYCLTHSNSHTIAKDFFIEETKKQPFGNRQHPFLNSPALFIYRHPLDILISEANYYHRHDNSSFSGYLSSLSHE